jgi:hypothetical protein
LTITGTSFTPATAVKFGSAAASNFTVESDSQITAIAPAGSGAVDVSVTVPAGTSVTSASDRFTYIATPPVITTPPAVATAQPTVHSSTSGGFRGSVNPEGLQTTAHFEYGLDPRYGMASGAVNYDQRTAEVSVGSDSSAHIVSALVARLLPNALYHVSLVATNSAGSSRGGDQTFTTETAPAPPPPTLGKTANLTPISGLVLIKPPPGKSLYAIGRSATSPVPTKGQGFIPLTQARQVPAGSQIDALRGTLQLVVATGKHHTAQTARLTGGVYTISQTARGLHKGLTTFSLNEGAFPGAPSYRSCTAKRAQTAAARPRARRPKLSSQVLQTLRASDHHGNFRTRGRYSAATVRGTDWGVKDRCDGTLTLVHRGTVSVSVFATRKTITVRAGHSYLARALTAPKSPSA